MSVATKKVILLIDGNNLAHRCKHVFSLSSKGEDVSVLYGFISVLISYIKKYNPTSIIVAWDGGIPKYRTVLLPSYKANRVRGTDDPIAYEIFKNQMKKLQSILPLLGVVSVQNYGSEADDLIYHAAKITGADEIIVISNDRDLIQTVDYRTHILLPSAKDGGTLVTKSEIEKHIPVRLSSYIDWRALIGDSSDNIPGVKMVGEITATRLFQEYGSLTKIVNAAEEGKIPGKIGQNIRDFGFEKLFNSILVMSLWRDKTGSKHALHKAIHKWVPFSKTLIVKFFMKYAFLSFMSADIYRLFAGLENVTLYEDIRYPIVCERRSPIE